VSGPAGSVRPSPAAGETTWSENRDQHRFASHFAHGEDPLWRAAGPAGVADERGHSQHASCPEVCRGDEACVAVSGNSDGLASIFFGQEGPAPSASLRAGSVSRRNAKRLGRGTRWIFGCCFLRRIEAPMPEQI